MKVVDKIEAILPYAKGKRVLDLGFLNHTLEGFKACPLHRELDEVSEELVGVDINAPNKDCGSGMLWHKGDACEPLFFGFYAFDYFDLIVAGDLIEHLDNFKGFFRNCRRYLKPGGKLILTTPNPFYIDGWLYSWLKSDVVINPEHTCWVCPSSMRELLGRLGFNIINFYWLKGGWNLFAFLPQDKDWWYEHRVARWLGNPPLSYYIGALLRVPWVALRWLLTLLSPLNRWAGYMVVCEVK